MLIISRSRIYLLTSYVLVAADPLPTLWTVVSVLFVLLQTGFAAELATA